MSLSELLDPLRPYVLALKVIGALAIASTLFVAGCRHGRASERLDHHDEVLRTTAQINGLTAQVNAARAALDAQAARVAAAVVEAQRMENAAADAAGVYAREAATLRRERQAYQARVLRVKAERPVCRALIETDIAKECGL
jgi:uncharacterized protein YdbL (DUF1318 family)